MYCKEITYTDYNDVERTEKFYFNISKTEMTELQYGRDGGLQEYLVSLLKSPNEGPMFSVFKEIILLAYGIKSEDGKRFMKSDDISESFEESPAFDVFMEELFKDENSAGDFLMKIMPKMTEEEKKEFNKKVGEMNNVTNFSKS